MASYDKSKDSAYTRQVQQVLSSLGADLGAGGIDGKWGAYTQAAYEANKAAVDAALYGSGGSLEARGRQLEEEAPLAVSPYPPVNTTPAAYVPQAIGISLARLLGLGSTALLFLGRLCNLLFFTGLTWLAMRRLPFGKEVLFGTALLPMTLHLSASFSYDVLIMGCMFWFTAVCLDLAYRQERVRVRDVVLLAALMADGKHGFWRRRRWPAPGRR